MSNIQSGSGTTSTLMKAPAAVEDPCSNDNPEFDKETQPCLGSVMDGIFEGAIEPTTTLPTLPKFDVSKFNLDTITTTTSTVAPDLNTAEMDMTPATVESEVPSFYSCSATSEDELNGRNDNDTLLLSFRYEIYTASTVEDFTTVLGALERRLTNGVATSLGLDSGDCPEGGGLAVEVSVRSAEGGERQLMPLRGMRRTIQKVKMVESNSRVLENVSDRSLVEGLSMDPADELDSQTLTCTTSVSLDVSATCYPIVGTMTAWISIAEQRRSLQQQQQVVSAEDQESALYDSIQAYIEQNQSAFLSEELLHVAYIGRADDAQLAGKPIQIDMNANKDVGMSAGLIGVIVSAVVLAFVAFGFALAYRRRRRSRGGMQEARSGLDLERGVFPVLVEEGDLDTQDALASQDNKDANRYNSLFGLSGSRSDDSSAFDNVLISPSSCTTIGVANTVPRQFFPSSPTNSPNGEMAEEQTTPRNKEDSYDMAPLSPMNNTTRNEEDEKSDSSSADTGSVLEVIDDDSDDMTPIPALMSPRDIGNAKMQGSSIV